MDIIKTILALAYTVTIDGRFYVEFRKPSTSRNGKPSLELYVCGAEPDPEDLHSSWTIRMTGEIICDQVHEPSRRHEVYSKCNFYVVHQPTLIGITINLRTASGAVSPVPGLWNLGFSFEQLDHPNFGPPSSRNLEYLYNRVSALGIGDADIVPANLIDSLVQYFATINVIDLVQDAARTHALFSAFSTILERMVDRYWDYAQGLRDEDPIRSRLKSAVATPLLKMIDPCIVQPSRLTNGDYYVSAFTRFCHNFCKFLAVSARLHRTTPECSSLLSGACYRQSCMCFQKSTLVSCFIRPQILMRRCNNKLRLQLNARN